MDGGGGSQGSCIEVLNTPKRRNLGPPRSRAHVSPTLSTWPKGFLLSTEGVWVGLSLPVWADEVSPGASQLVPAYLSVSEHVGWVIPVPRRSPPSTALPSSPQLDSSDPG